MGQLSNLTNQQKLILSAIFENDYCRKLFYFTGGTALSSAYLSHRESDDLDFFTEAEYDRQTVFTSMSQWAESSSFTFQVNLVEVTQIFNITFSDNSKLKVDFAYYPYPRLEASRVIDGVPVDSLKDIAVNKLITLSQRNEVKDFVDLYFLLEKYTVWDLINGVKVKFKVDQDPYIVSANFLKVEDFDYLPKMTVPLSLDQLKNCFRQKAMETGRKSVE